MMTLFVGSREQACIYVSLAGACGGNKYKHKHEHKHTQTSLLSLPSKSHSSSPLPSLSFPGKGISQHPRPKARKKRKENEAKNMYILSIHPTLRSPHLLPASLKSPILLCNNIHPPTGFRSPPPPFRPKNLKAMNEKRLLYVCFRA